MQIEEVTPNGVWILIGEHEQLEFLTNTELKELFNAIIGRGLKP